MDAAEHAPRLQPLLVLRRPVGAVRPDRPRRVGPRDQPLAELTTVVAGSVGDGLAADQPVHPVDRNMALVAVDRDRDVDRLRAVGACFGLGILDGPAAIHVFLPRLCGLVRPDVGGTLTLLDLCLLAIRVSLPWRRDQAGIDDLAAPRQVTRRRDRPVESCEQFVQRARRDQGLSEVPQRVRMRHTVFWPELTEPHPRQPVAHQILGLLERQPV